MRPRCLLALGLELFKQSIELVMRGSTNDRHSQPWIIHAAHAGAGSKMLWYGQSNMPRRQ
jgi:hypothetical protein